MDLFCPENEPEYHLLYFTQITMSMGPAPLLKVLHFASVQCTNKAPGIDKVPSSIIKDSLSAILPSITSIINATFQLSTFPSCWKIAKVDSK